MMFNRSSAFLAGFFGLLLLLFQSCDVVRYVENRTETRYRSRGGAPQTLDLDGNRLSYRVLGKKGEPLLLIHGFGPAPAQQWVEQIKPFSRKHRLIIPDMLYFGNSRPLGGRRPYSPEFQAELLKKLIDSLQLPKVHLLGTSYGGLVASLFYIKYGDRVDKIVLTNAPVKFYRRSYADSLAQSLGRPDAVQLLLPETGDDLQRLLEAALLKTPKLKTSWRDTIVSRYYFDQRQDRIELLQYLSRSENFLNSLSYKTTKPVLLIWGESDRLVPLEVGKKLQTHIGPGARLLVLPKAAHVPNSEQTKLFNKEVLRFLAGPKPASEPAKK